MAQPIETPPKDPASPQSADPVHAAVVAALAQMRANPGNFPTDAFNVLTANRQAAPPLLLDVVERAAADPTPFTSEVEDYRLFVSLAVLAQFGEPRALAPTLSILHAPEETLDGLFGDVLSSYGDVWLAGFAGGQVEPLQRLVQNTGAAEEARAVAVGAVVLATARGQCARDTTEQWLRELMQRADTLQSDWIVGELVCAALDLGAKSLLPDLEALFATGLVDPIFAGDWQHVQAELQSQQDHALAETLLNKLDPPDAAAMLAWLWRPEDRSWANPVAQPGKRTKDPKAKAKRKQAKASRKKNRRK